MLRMLIRWSSEQLRSGLRRASPCPVATPVKLADAVAKRPVPPLMTPVCSMVTVTMQVRGSTRERGALQGADEVHAAVVKDEVVSVDVFRVVWLAGDLDDLAAAVEDSRGDNPRADNLTLARGAGGHDHSRQRLASARLRRSGRDPDHERGRGGQQRNERASLQSSHRPSLCRDGGCPPQGEPTPTPSAKKEPSVSATGTRGRAGRERRGLLRRINPARV